MKLVLSTRDGQKKLSEFSTVEEYKDKVKKFNISDMVTYSIFYTNLIKGHREMRERYVLGKSYELWWNTFGATYWSIR